MGILHAVIALPHLGRASISNSGGTLVECPRGTERNSKGFKFQCIQKQQCSREKKKKTEKNTSETCLLTCLLDAFVGSRPKARCRGPGFGWNMGMCLSSEPSPGSLPKKTRYITHQLPKWFGADAVVQRCGGWFPKKTYKKPGVQFHIQTPSSKLPGPGSKSPD